jgi:flagellar FliJ protein
MKAFRFSLQAILTLREEREQEAQRHYARKLRAAEVINTALEAVVQQLLLLGTEQNSRLQNGMPASDLERLGNYRILLDERRARLNQDLALARQAADQAQAALLKATQDRQALEDYRKKLHRTYDYALARDEQKLLDDLASRGPTLAGDWRRAPETSIP